MRGDSLSSLMGIVFIGLIPELRAPAQVFWINEFHYDNSGSDLGEFVEVVAPALFTDLGAVHLTLYNGGDGQPYGVTHGLDTFAPGDSVSGWTLYSKAIAGVQNGAPDGMALDHEGALIQFVSYEGVFTAAAGPAAGQLSVEIGVSESDSTLAGSSLGLSGTGSLPGDFTWSALATATPGFLNPGQVAVPEPRTVGLMTGIGLGALGVWRICARGRGAP